MVQQTRISEFWMNSIKDATKDDVRSKCWVNGTNQLNYGITTNTRLFYV